MKDSVEVTDGLFIVELDFGAVFDGTDLWLEIEVGSTVLSPRQHVTAAPQALFAATAGGAQTAALATALSSDGSDCATGQFAAGVDASGSAQGCATGPTSTDSAGGSSALNMMQPFQTINFIISITGDLPGEIKMFAGDTAPTGYLFCDGQLLQIESYPDLFDVLDIAYGGDGRFTFALPDLRGRVALGEGTGPELSMRDLGERAGRETRTLTTAQVASHSHPITP